MKTREEEAQQYSDELNTYTAICCRIKTKEAHLAGQLIGERRVIELLKTEDFNGAGPLGPTSGLICAWSLEQRLNETK